MVQHQTPEREVGGSKPTSALSLSKTLPESAGNTQEAVAPSRHDWKIVAWDVNLHTNKTKPS